MNQTKTNLLLIFACILMLSACHTTASRPPAILVPHPLSSEAGNGAFRFTENTVLAVPGDQERMIAENFAALFARSAGFTPSVRTGQEGDIVFTPDTTLKAEAYTLCVTPKRIDITAADTRGYFYALQSLRQMLPPAIEGNTQKEEDWSIPAVTIKDEPRFGYRSYMLDVARYFLPKEDVLRMIDCIALLKINRTASPC